MTVSLLLLFLSIVCFMIAGLAPQPRVRFEWLGFAFYVAAQAVRL